MVLPSLDAATQARLRSQSGAHAGDHLTALPTCEYTVATPERMNGMLRRRARLPLVTGHRRDAFGDYGAAWPRDGGLRRRGAAFERAFRPLWNESTVTASEHPLVRELVPTVPATDGRQADVLIRGMSIGNGRPVVGDMCMGSALHANGRPYPDAATTDGKAIERLTDQKHDDYPELVASDRVHYVVLVSGGTCAVVEGVVGGGIPRLPAASRPRVDRTSPVFSPSVVLVGCAGWSLGSELPPAAPPGTGKWLGGGSSAGPPAAPLVKPCWSLGSRLPSAGPPGTGVSLGGSPLPAGPLGFARSLCGAIERRNTSPLEPSTAVFTCWCSEVDGKTHL